MSRILWDWDSTGMKGFKQRTATCGVNIKLVILCKYVSYTHIASLSPPATQMAMLLKLQESANYIESPEREGCLDPTLQATL